LADRLGIGRGGTGARRWWCAACFQLTIITVCRDISGAQLAARPLSLAEANRLSQAASHIGRQFDARFDSAASRVQAAGAVPNPTLQLAQPYGENTGGLDEGIILTQTMELGDKRRQRLRAAEAERAAAQADRLDARTNVQLATETAYFEAERADEDVRTAQENLDSARAFANTADVQYTAGDVPRANVVRSEVEVTRAEQALDTAQTDRENRYATLRSLMGLPHGTPITLTDPLRFEPHEYSLTNLREVALRSRSDIASARRTLEARQALLHGAKAASAPDFFVEARHETLDVTAGGSSVRFGVVFPVADYGRTRSDVNAAKAAVAEQTAVVNEMERTAGLEVETAYRLFDQSRRAVASFEGGRLARSKELLDIAQTGYQHGANTFLELLDAQQIYRAEKAEYSRALAAYNIALATLRHAVGGALR
jgi:cobalt-zinc-cadmium efflux system outer membrane protein